MGKTIKMLEINNNDDFYKKYYGPTFLKALYEGEISIVSGQIINTRYKSEINCMALGQFMFYVSETFRHIFDIDLPKGLKEENVDPEMIKDFYAWTNPQFKNLDFEPFNRFLEKLETKVEKDEAYREVLRKNSFEALKIIRQQELRKKYIDRLIDLNVLEERDKVDLVYFLNLPISEIKKFISENVLTDYEITELVVQKCIELRDLESRASDSKKQKHRGNYNSKIVETVNLLSGYEIADAYVTGSGDLITENEFVRTKVTKDDILLLPYNSIIEFLEEKNTDTLPKRLKVTSKDLINKYGRNFSGEAIYKFFERGYIELGDLIDIFEINKALRASGFDGEFFDDDELRAIYSSEVLFDMKEKDELTPEFIEKYKNMYEFDKKPEVFNIKSRLLADSLRELLSKRDEKLGSNLFEENILYFFENGLCDTQTAGENISEEYIDKMVKSGKFSRDNLFKLFEKGVISDEIIIKYYNDVEILKLYEEGKVGKNCLRAVKDVDRLLEAVSDEKISIVDFEELYLKTDVVSISDLKDGLELSDSELTGITNLIDENTPYEKIKSLATDLLIGFSDVRDLKNRGIIDDEEFKEISESINVTGFRNRLGKEDFRVVTSRKNEKSYGGRSFSMTYEENEDFLDEITLISRVFERYVEGTPYSKIESHNEKGAPTSLNGYRIFEDNDLVILQKSKKGNAVFVMDIRQLMYFLDGKENENGEIEDRMRDKAYLRTLTGVEVVEHSRHFARNLIEAVSRVSSEYKESLRDEDGKYKKDVQSLIDNMRKEYDIDRSQVRN